MSKKILCALALALFIQFVCAQNTSYLPPHAQANENNLALSNSQKQDALPSYSQQFQPTITSPFPTAYVRALAAMPSVDGRVSEFHQPKILWAWGVSFVPQMHREYVPEKGWDGCYRETTSISSAGKPTFVGSASFVVAGKSASQPAGSTFTGVPDALWKNLSVQRGENNSPILPALSFTISGHIEMPYSVVRTVCRMSRQMQPGGVSEGCSCEPLPAQTIRLRTPDLSHQRNWSIELGKPLGVLLLPVAGEQLSFRPKTGMLIFSSHKASQISLLSSGKELNTSYFSQFHALKGEAGELQVFSEDMRQYGQNFSGMPGIATAGFPSLMKSNSSTTYSNPFPLDRLNRSFAYQYYIEASSPFPAGKNNITIYFLSQFGDEELINWPFLARDASYVSVDGSITSVNAKAEKTPIPSSSAADGTVQKFHFAGNDSVRPSSAFLTENLKGMEFDSPLPFALLSFLGALWLFRQGSS